MGGHGQPKRRHLGLVPAMTLALIASGSATGCAFADSNIRLNHSSPRYTGLPAQGLLVLREVVDARSDRRRVGIQKNGYEWETANIKTPTDIRTLVTGALRAELTAAGFTVLGAPGPGDNRPHLLVEGDITQFFAEPRVSNWDADIVSEVILDMRVSYAGRQLQRRFVGRGSKEVMIWTDSAFKASIEQALEAVVVEFTTEVVRLVHGMPGGRPAA